MFINKLPLTRIKIFIAKILFKIITPFTGKKHRIINRNGIFYEVDLTEGIDLSLFIFGNFQKHVTNNKFLDLTADSTIFDVGGNFGIMALQFAKKASNGHVFSFEPTHYAFNRFARNLELNKGLNKRIELIKTFVSCEETEEANIKAFSSWKVSGEKKTKEQHPIHLGTPKSAEGVGSITLDNFCLTRKITKIDLIKIDTDGHEYNVLKGAKECIHKFRPRVIFEVGQYVMKEKEIDFRHYINYFSSENYLLLDSNSGRIVTSENHLKIIPLLGTIDIIALPQ